MAKLPVDLLVFDFDGTLADSIPAAVDSIIDMMKELGYPPKTHAEIKPHIGFGEVALVAGAIGSTDPALINKAQSVYYKHVMSRIAAVPLFPDVREMLEYFKDKTKVIVSNKRDQFIHLILEHHGLKSYFKEILGGDAAPCLKPDPCVLLRVFKEYNLKPKRCLFIGDMVIDIATGRNAGAHTCAVTYGVDGRAKLAKAKPDFLVDDLLTLKGLIE